MQSTVINGELKVTYPDNFKEMSQEEIERKTGTAYPDKWVISDEEKHMSISIIWKKSGAILSALANAKDISKANASKLKNTLKNNDYELEESFETEVCGIKTYGLRYSYTAKGKRQQGQAVVLKNKRVCYTISFYIRKENEAELAPVFEQFLADLSLN